MIKLNLGCGSVRPNGWINTDSSLNANIQRIPFLVEMFTKAFGKVQYSSSNFIYMNLNKKWRYADNSVDVVYASHLFEHLTLKSADIFLKEAFRTLKPNGILRIVVPDLYVLAKKYIADYESGNFDSKSTDYFLWAINMHREGQYGNPNFFKKVVYELQGYPHQHKFMYDNKSLATKVKSYGFKEIEFFSYGVSKNIEDIHLLEGTQESYLSVYLECKK